MISPTIEPIIEGTMAGNATLVASALKNGANPNTEFRYWTALRWAVQEDYYEVAELLIKHGADIENRDKVEGFSILDAAVGSANVAIVELLLNSGADVNGPTANTTVLHTACAYGLYEIAMLLLEKGVVTNVKDPDGKLPVDYAMDYGHTDIVALLQTVSNI